jgi:myo-inositol 2-dehydrogenase/D-chiro-inositol 1-dehydrogenase
MKKIKFGIIGLGRLGIKHAENIALHTPGAELMAVCALEEDVIEKAKKDWSVKYGYNHFDDMIQNKELDAIFICSPSSQHCDQIALALEAGFHVFSEKPLGISLEECRKAEAAVEKHPNKVFMLGFMRRFDPSYMYAKQKVDAGEIGKPILFRGYSVDPISSIESAIQFARHSGGQFLDMAIHDIDLARWFLKSEAKTCYAIGGCYAYEEFAQFHDGDNCTALMQFQNDAMAFFLAGRTASHGYNVETEIIGTKGTLRIAGIPQKNHVEILDQHGVRRECSTSFIERFDQAYLNELHAFVKCIQTGEKPDVTVYDGTNSTIAAYAATESFRKNTLVHICYD